MAGSKDLAFFVLAGGKSTRMGKDKAFVNFNGQTLLARALAVAHELTDDVRIAGVPEKFAAYAPVVEDEFQECGPLGGIHAALRSSSAGLNLMLAVDMPFVTSEFLRYLVGIAEQSPTAAVVVPMCDGREQWLCAIYRREFCDAAEAALEAGKNKIGLLSECVTTRVIDEAEWRRHGFSSELFRNLNTVDELERARELGSRQT
jgi:molybdopterin-guanine dinucleotide biosynthesis protein A